MNAQRESTLRAEPANDPSRVLAGAFNSMLHIYREALEEPNLESGDLILLQFIATEPQWREKLIDFLLNVTGDDPERILQRAVEAGRIAVEDDGRLSPTNRVEEYMARLFPLAQTFNTSWRNRLAEAFSPDDLDIFLQMLQQAGDRQTAEAV